MTNLSEASALDAARAIARGVTTSQKLIEACLDRILAREHEVGAWAYLDAEGALAQARKLDSQDPRSPLHGIPVGVKDVIDTVDMPTSYGSALYDDHRPRRDAACVALLRAAGMIVLGKTVTTEFAFRLPGKTRNPANGAHTPGGSSSGSAAAVADFMVPLALGTQTGGSVIRPASYCGAVGYKPSFGDISRVGVNLIAESLDTMGVFARTVDDAAALAGVLSGARTAPPPPGLSAPPRVGLCRTRSWNAAEPPARAALERAAERIAQRGAFLGDADLSPIFDDWQDTYQIIQGYEGWRSFAYEREIHSAQLSDILRDTLKRGGSYSREDYQTALNKASKYRIAIDKIMRDYDVLLTPSAPGEAPLGYNDLGAATFNALWTLLGVPCVTLPFFTGPRGLPVGVQVVGRRSADDAALAVASWIHEVLSA